MHLSDATNSLKYDDLSKTAFKIADAMIKACGTEGSK